MSLKVFKYRIGVFHRSLRGGLNYLHEPIYWLKSLISRCHGLGAEAFECVILRDCLYSIREFSLVILTEALTQKSDSQDGWGVNPAYTRDRSTYKGVSSITPRKISLLFVCIYFSPVCKPTFLCSLKPYFPHAR